MAVILHVTDMQGDFGAQDGVLYVPGGTDVTRKINDFMDALPSNAVDVAVFTYDTHPWFSYFSSPECLPFPAIHCEQDKKGWQLVVDAGKMTSKAQVVYAPKETFDVWQDKATSNVDVKTRGTIGSNMSYMQFLQDLQNKGATFVDRAADRATFGKAVDWDFDKDGAFTGKVTVWPYEAQFAGKIKEGFYVVDGENGKEVVAIANENLVKVYNNVGKITTDAACFDGRMARDSFLSDDYLAGCTVIMTGLASNFCVHDALKGYLERGAKVVVIEDLVAGIPNGVDAQKAIEGLTGVDRTATGDIRDVLKTRHFENYVITGQVELTSAADFLERYNKVAPTPVAANRNTPK